MANLKFCWPLFNMLPFIQYKVTETRYFTYDGFKFHLCERFDRGPIAPYSQRFLMTLITRFKPLALKPQICVCSNLWFPFNFMVIWMFNCALCPCMIYLIGVMTGNRRWAVNTYFISIIISQPIDMLNYLIAIPWIDLVAKKKKNRII